VSRDADVIVVGAGNAGFCAAHAAAQRGARVMLLENAPPEWLGGNSYFIAGAIRSVHHGLRDVLSLVEPIDAADVEATDLDPYAASEFRDDMRRVTEGRADPELTELLGPRSTGLNLEDASDDARVPAPPASAAAPSVNSAKSPEPARLTRA
jgi:tricarballylate dehydrogenase